MPDSLVKILTARRASLTAFVLFIFALFPFFGALHHTNLLFSSRDLAFNLVSPPNSPQLWESDTLLPFKYRILFKWIVHGTFQNLFDTNDSQAFYATFVAYSILFFFVSVLCLFLFQRRLGLSRNYALLGCFFFAISPPALLAYFTPVMTREDPLAYALIIAGLYSSTFRGGTIRNICICILAALCRETTLILPLYLLFSSSKSLLGRTMPLALSALTVLGVRFVVGFETYDVFWGGRTNLQHPYESLCFLFLAFGFLWVTAILASKKIPGAPQEPQNTNLEVLKKSFPLTLFLVICTTSLWARMHEIRLLFILFPWVIVLSVYWMKQQEHVFTPIVQTKKVIVPLLASLLTLILSLTLSTPLFQAHERFGVATLWQTTCSLHLMITVFVFVLYLREQRHQHSLH